MYLIHSALAWGFLMVAAPLIIHLLNLLRQRRLEWAAMDFLLQSHRKRRHWVWLKQLLLLLCRMVAIALAVSMFGRIVSLDRLASWFRSESVHFYLLVDDSYSMEDRSGAATGLDRAVAALRSIVENAARQEGRQRFSLLRFSDSAHNQDEGEIDTEAAAREITREDEWTQAWAELGTTESAVGPLPALKLVQQLVSQRTDESAQVVVASDFRRLNWEDAPDVLANLRQLHDQGVRVQFIRCSDRQHANLAVRDVRQTTPRAAVNVPVQVVMEIQNYGPEEVQQVPIRFLTRTFRDPQDLQGTTAVLPEQTISLLPAGEMAEVRAQVVFNEPGEHIVEVRVPDDALEVDNARWQVVAVTDHLPVLIIAEGDAEEDAYFLQSVFQPDATTSTGFRALVQPTSFLRQIRALDLNQFVSVYLLDCPALDDSVYQKLSDYVRQGGGLACFAGPQSDTDFWNAGRMSVSGEEPLLNLTARAVRELPLRAADDAPDLQPLHSIFRVLQGDRNPWLATVRFERYMEVDWSSSASADARWEVAARLRNDHVLAATRRMGQGQLLVFLSTLGPRWNNWARQPSFVVFVLTLQDYLTSSPQLDRTQVIGVPRTLRLPSSTYRRNYRLVGPWLDDRSEPAPQARQMEDADSQVDQTAAGGTSSFALTWTGGPSSAATRQRGYYRVQLSRTDGETEARDFALNVDPQEGDLRVLSRQELQQEYDGLSIDITSFAETQSLSPSSNRTSWSQWLLAPLALLLFAEQLLAYSTSYHPSMKAA